MAADNRGGQSRVSISEDLWWEDKNQREMPEVRKGRPGQLPGTQTCAQF